MTKIKKQKIKVLAFVALLIAAFAVNMIQIPATTAADSWIQTINGQSLKAYPNLREFVWQENVSSAPYDKVGLHRLVLANSVAKGVVFMLPGIYGNGEKLVSNTPDSNFTLTENMSQCVYWANRGFDVYTIDYRTHFVPSTLNASQLSFMANWSLDQMINDIKGAVDKAKQESGASKIFLAGQSLGGNWAQFYAAKYWQEDLRGLILLDPAVKSTISKNSVTTNTFNITSNLIKMNSYGNWSWENPQQSYTLSPLNPGYLFLTQYATANPDAPAQWPNGTKLTPLLNPLTNKTWTNITEWFDYRANSGGSSNTYEGYGNTTVNMISASQVDRYFPVRPFLEAAAMLDWNNCTDLPYDYILHVKEIDVPVLGFRSGLLGVPSYGNLTNGMTTNDFTSIVLPKYGHTDVFQGIYSASDVSEPSIQWMLSHTPQPKVTQAPTPTPIQTPTLTPTPTPSPTTTPTPTPPATQNPTATPTSTTPLTTLPTEAIYAIVISAAIVMVALATVLIRKRGK
jgi:pimeloyl-ACP methyl ester carboxylesterase